MNKRAKPTTNDLSELAEDARALLAATADVAEEKVAEARKRLAEALDRVKEIASQVQEKTMEGAKAADEAVREHPYRAVALALGVGALIGYLAGHRCSRGKD